MKLDHSSSACRQRRSPRWSAAVGVVLAVAVVATGCGSSGSDDSGSGAAQASGTESTHSQSEFNAADAKPYAVKGDDPSRPPVRLKGWVPNHKASKEYSIGYFTATPVNTYIQAANYAVKTVAQSLGVNVDIVQADWDTQQQLNQLQTAIQQHQYDGIVASAVDGDAECRMLSKTVPEANIPIVIENFPICSDVDYTEGTVGVSASQSLPFYQQYVDWALGELAKKGGGKVGVLLGPAEEGLSKQFKVALEQGEKKYAADGVEVVRVINDEYTAEGGLREAQTILQAVPDVDMLLSSYDQNTLGAQKALVAAGKKPGDVLLYNLGGDHSTFPLMKEGWIQGMMYLEPMEEAAQAIEMMVAHLEGVQGLPKFNNLGKDTSTPAGTVEITPKNLSKFVPEF